jgi:hypothetical protein
MCEPSGYKRKSGMGHCKLPQAVDHEQAQVRLLDETAADGDCHSLRAVEDA